MLDERSDYDVAIPTAEDGGAVSVSRYRRDYIDGEWRVVLDLSAAVMRGDEVVELTLDRALELASAIADEVAAADEEDA